MWTGESVSVLLTQQTELSMGDKTQEDYNVLH